MQVINIVWWCVHGQSLEEAFISVGPLHIFAMSQPEALTEHIRKWLAVKEKRRLYGFQTYLKTSSQKHDVYLYSSIMG